VQSGIRALPPFARFSSKSREKDGAPERFSRVLKVEVCGFPPFAKYAKDGAPERFSKIMKVEVCGFPPFAKYAKDGARRLLWLEKEKL
jgi:hypothetical protein